MKNYLFLGSMGVPHSKPEERFNYINRELSTLRNSVRISKNNLTPEKRNSIVKNLADASNEVKSMTGKIKQKKIDETLKKIGSTMQEILSEDKNGLDSHELDSESILQLAVNKRNTSANSSTRSSKSTKSKKPSNDKQKRASIPTLMDIEVKFYDLRPKISNAIENHETHLLRIYQQTLKTIAGDMEMIETIQDTPMDDLKNKLSKQLTLQYQKISKALKDFKRNDNIQYLSKQSIKSKSLQDLNNIEIQLAQTESLMDKMTKDQNDVDFSTIRNNLVKINEKLRSVNCIDDDIKQKTVGLTQKFKEIVKNNESLMEKRDFDYNYTQSVQKLESLINTFDANTDKNNFLNSLENLHQCVEKLEGFNETTKNKKKNLLNQINKHKKELQNFVRHSQQSTDGKTVQQIVEDNVELRKKIRSSNKEHTVIDQFYNYWTNVKNNFNISAYSNISLLRLDSVLEDMQTSIMDIRENIAEKCDLKSNRDSLDRMTSQSMPKLTLNKHNSAYGSHRSINQLNDENKIIRTKVKMYHLSTPELLNAQKEFLDEQHENKRFSKIEEIRTQVYYIKEKINENHNKNLLRDKLEHYLKLLHEFLRDSNKIVANNANIVTNEIRELIHKLYLADIKESLQTLAIRADNFQGNKFDKDFEEIRENLIQLQITLENMSIPPQYEQLERDRNEMLDAMSYHIQHLESKVVYYQTKDENVKKIHNRLLKAKEQIKRFTGVYKGPLYNAIERDLNKILMDLECIEDKSVADEATKGVEIYLKILEQKASTPQSFRGNKDLASKALHRVSSTSDIRENLLNIRTEIDRTSDHNQTVLEGLKSRLDLVNLELGQISAKSSENLLKEKDIFTNEVETLLNVVEAKITLGQQPDLPLWPESRRGSVEFRKTDITKEMEIISSKFDDIKKQAKTQKPKYDQTLDDLQNLLVELDKFKFIRGTDLDFQKLKLYNEIVFYKDGLEKRFKEEQTLDMAEKTLGEIETDIDSKQPTDFVKMIEDIQAIQKKLDSLRHNSNLSDRTTSCEIKSEELVQQIKDLQEKKRNEKLNEMQITKSTLVNAEEKLKTIKQQVNSFVGIKSGSKFDELDRSIRGLITELDRLDTNNENTLKHKKTAVLKELRQQEKVLEERTNQTREIEYLEDNLEKVSNMIKSYSGSSDNYQQIKRLMEELGKKVHSVRCYSDLVLRKNACIEKYSVLFNKVLAMGNSLDVNRSVENTKGISSRVFNFLDKPSPDDILKQIENEIYECKPKVDAFQNVQQSSEFQDVDDFLTKCTMKLNKLDIPRNTALDKKKMDLMQLIEDLSVVLEQKAESLEAMDQVEATLKTIGEQMKSSLPHDTVDHIDEALIEMQIKLGKIKNHNLKPRKDACMMSIILYMGQINEIKQHIKTTAV